MNINNDKRPLQDLLRDRRYKLGMTTRYRVANHVEALEAEVAALKHDIDQLYKIATDEANATDEAAAHTKQAIWERLQSAIKTGPLPGNGCDESAQRNGIVLAANMVLDFQLEEIVQKGKPV